MEKSKKHAIMGQLSEEVKGVEYWKNYCKDVLFSLGYVGVLGFEGE